MTNTKQKVRKFFEEKQEFYLDMLKQMVDINSFTENPPGINKLGEVTAECFADLDLVPEFVDSVHAHYGRHLVLTRQGRSNRKIGLISHLDTVYPEEEERRNDFKWKPVGDKIYGPGTIDIKGGTVMIHMLMAAMQEFAPEAFEDITWVVLLDASEEDDARDFGELCLQKLDEDTIAGLVFECGYLDESFCKTVVARKGRAIFDVKVEGKASHSGTFHEKGANAIIQMADVLQQIHKLTDYDQTRTVTVAVVKGGTVSNRVPHHAEATVEMRAFLREAYEEGKEKILSYDGYSTVSSPDNSFQCKVDVSLYRETAPWPRNPGTDRLFGFWKDAAASLGLEMQGQERGGLSDGNLICHKVPVLDGLGPSGANAHCSESSEDGSKEQEYLTVSSLVPKAQMNTLALLALLEDELK